MTKLRREEVSASELLAELVLLIYCTRASEENQLVAKAALEGQSQCHVAPSTTGEIDANVLSGERQPANPMFNVSMASEAIVSSERDAIDNEMSGAHQTSEAMQVVSDEVRKYAT